MKKLTQLRQIPISPILPAKKIKSNLTKAEQLRKAELLKSLKERGLI